MRSAGDDLISVGVADSVTAQALAEKLRASGFWIEAVAGINSVVAQFDISKFAREEAEQLLSDALQNLTAFVAGQAAAIEIPIEYGGEHGPDLEFVCKMLGLPKDEFIALHCGEYTVDMLGFTPGFAYIGGLDDRLVVDRLPEPRLRLPAGSVGIAGGRTGLYSLPGPGGWPIIGRTSRILFDASLDNPFTLAAGATVLFTAVDSI